MRWRGWLTAPTPGKYSLRLLADDGVRLWLDDKKLIDSWVANPGMFKNAREVDVDLTGTPQQIRVEFHDYNQEAFCKLAWKRRDDPAALDYVPVPAGVFHTTYDAARKK